MSFRLGIDVFLNDRQRTSALKGKRVALLAHPASITRDWQHSVDAIAQHPDLNLTACFGPQHGMRGDKQDNMMETKDEIDEQLGIPVFSLYGEVRRPTADMLNHFDVLLIDLQDVGCRIYTFLTTLFYLLDDCATHCKSIIVLDRPNPAGRMIEGFTLEAGQKSFVGGAELPMRHGLTLGEAANWYVHEKDLDVDLQVVAMEGYSFDHDDQYGWPQSLAWINPSPNLATLNAARVYSGTVILEGTTLSEGRGTTRALELFGAPDLDMKPILSTMRGIAPQCFDGMRIRECWFEPTFHKYAGKLCSGLQLHTDVTCYDVDKARPFRLMLLFLKAIRLLDADYPLWRDFPYEYEFDRLAIDVINGGSKLRKWVDDSEGTFQDLEQQLKIDERNWFERIESFKFY